MSACVLACIFTIRKLWTQFYISGLTWEQGWLRSVCPFSQYDQPLLNSLIIYDGCTYLRHTMDYRKYNNNKKTIPSHFMWRGINAEVSLKLYLSVSNIYIALSINIPFLAQYLIFLYSKTTNLKKIFVNERIAEFLPCDSHSLFESQSVECLT